MRLLGDLRIERFVIGGGDHQRHLVQIARLIASQNHLATILSGQLAQFLEHLGRDHAQLGPGIGQQARLAQRDLATTDHQNAAVLQLMKEGKVIHERIPYGR
ncbi:hypothetical protein D3C77_621240 [compost metagenome]